MRADAYIAHYPFLNKLVLPAGVSDLLNNRPPIDTVMLAPKASLAVRADLHPAIQHLLLTAAQQIHSPPGIFQKAGQFPAAESIDLPLSDEAQRFYKRGLPFLQKYLPFWVATLVERMLVVLLPLAAVLYPVFRFLPQIYDWAMQSKIRRLYDEMRAIENEMEIQEGKDVDAIDAKLEDLSQRANRLSLPRSLRKHGVHAAQPYQSCPRPPDIGRAKKSTLTEARCRRRRRRKPQYPAANEPRVRRSAAPT